MRSRIFGNSRRLTAIFRLCLCLAVAGIIILGATDRTTAASSAAGSALVINVFSADPMTLKDGDSALYTFEVSGSTDMKVVENGVIIKEIHSPPNTTLKGTVRGNTTYEIQTGHITTFDTTLDATNASGGQVKTLTLSFATAPKVKSIILPAGQRGSDNRTPKWGLETYSTVASSITSTITQAPWPPQFAQCTPVCGNCLKPSDAAARGLTQKCSDQPCYYSPDEKQYWYCYQSNPVSVAFPCWHCKNGQAVFTTYLTGQQNSDNVSFSDCYSSQVEAQSHCQQSSTCWRCVKGQVFQYTGTATDYPCYASQAQAQSACQQSSTCYRCVGGQVIQSTTNVASDSPCYPTYDQAQSACQMCYCCKDGQVMHILQTDCQRIGGACYSSQSAANSGCTAATTNTNTATPAPAPCYCCHNGEVTQTTQAACARAGGTCHSTAAAAADGCKSTTTGTTGATDVPTCWCCHGGNVAQTSQSACAQAGGTCYSSQSAATAGCTRILHINPNQTILNIPITPTIK